MTLAHNVSRSAASGVAWSEEGNAKDAPRRRWLALAEHSLVGDLWMPVVDRCLSGGTIQSPGAWEVFLAEVFLAADRHVAASRSAAEASSAP